MFSVLEHVKKQGEMKREDLVKYLKESYGYSEGYVSIVIIPQLKLVGLGVFYKNGAWQVKVIEE